jgi:hypothetical protein
MEFGGWFLVISIALVLVLFSLLRRRGGPGKYPEVVQFILYDVKLNQIIADNLPKYVKPKTFEYTNWVMNKTRIGFLTETLKKNLKEVFVLVDEYNKLIKTARKEKSESYKSIDLTRFKTLLEECRKELEDWMMTNTGMKELPPKYPTLSSFFFGDR